MSYDALHSDNQMFKSLYSYQNNLYGKANQEV
jgi:hypothetical protein